MSPVGNDETNDDRPTPLRNAAAVLGLALYWCTSLAFYDAASVEELMLNAGGRADMPSAQTLFSVSILAITVATIAIVAAHLLPKRLDCAPVITPRAWRLATPIAGVAASLGTLAMMAGPVVGLPGALVYLGSILMGAGGAVIMLAWGMYVCCNPTGTSHLIIPAGFFVCSIAQLLKWGLPSQGVIVFDVLTSVFSAALWLLSTRGRKLPTRAFAAFTCIDKVSIAPETANMAPLGRNSTAFSEIPWKLVGLFFLCSFAGAVIETVGASFYPNVAGPVGATVTIVVSGVLLASAVWIVALKKRDFASVWPLFILVLLGSLTVLPATGIVDPQTSAYIVVAEKRCLVVLLWVFMAGLIFRNELPVVVAFGLGHVALQSLPNFLGQVVGGWAAAALPGISGNFTGLTIAMAFVIVVAVVLALYDRSILLDGFKAPERRVERGADDAPDGADPVQAIADQYGLSTRERQIMALLVRGHTYPRICDELGISINTIRTHSRNIYAKLDVHSKQELVDLVEGEAPTAVS